MARAIGVTRLADVSGLDRIGLPMFQAIRPLALSLSVSQGKGLTPDAARVSALMEAIELDRAERIAPDSIGPATCPEAALWARLPPARDQAALFDRTRPRGWLHGADLLGGGSVRVPHGIVSMDCTAPPADDLWPNTNGLASGNTVIEAQVSALCEVIERDSEARWIAATASVRRATMIDPATITDRAGRWLLARIARAGLRCTLWDMSAAHGIAAIGCAIIELGPARAVTLPPAWGAACHPRAAIALAGAIGEAAQARAALIAGARDDLSPEVYRDPGGQRASLSQMMRDFGGGPMRPWRKVPDHDPPTAGAMLDHLLRLCADTGAGAAACIDMNRPAEGIAVVRLVVPCFGDHDRPSALPPIA